MIVAFRKHTLLPLDDCLYALQASIPHLTRSSLHRCLQRHDISRLPEVGGDKPKRGKFSSYPIGYFHIDMAEVRTGQNPQLLLHRPAPTTRHPANNLNPSSHMSARMTTRPFALVIGHQRRPSKGTAINPSTRLRARRPADPAYADMRFVAEHRRGDLRQRRAVSAITDLAAYLYRLARIDILLVRFVRLAPPYLPGRLARFDGGLFVIGVALLRRGDQGGIDNLTTHGEITSLTQLLLESLHQRLKRAPLGEPVTIVRMVFLSGIEPPRSKPKKRIQLTGPGS